jgi:hypothetical protein
MILTGQNKQHGEKHVPVSLCPPQIPHGLVWDWIGAFAVKGRRLWPWAKARLCFRHFRVGFVIGDVLNADLMLRSCWSDVIVLTADRLRRVFFHIHGQRFGRCPPSQAKNTTSCRWTCLLRLSLVTERRQASWVGSLQRANLSPLI